MKSQLNILEVHGLNKNRFQENAWKILDSESYTCIIGCIPERKRKARNDLARCWSTSVQDLAEIRHTDLAQMVRAGIGLLCITDLARISLTDSVWISRLIGPNLAKVTLLSGVILGHQSIQLSWWTTRWMELFCTIIHRLVHPTNPLDEHMDWSYLYNDPSINSPSKDSETMDDTFSVL